MRSRRDFLLAGLATAGSGAALLAGCRGDGQDGGGGVSARERELGLLNRALALEHTAVAAYTAGAGLLRGARRLEVGTFREQEREHADRLGEVIRRLGGVPRPPKTAEEYARSFPALRSPDDLLEFAVDLENLKVATYVETIPELTDPDLRQLAASIVTVEAEHVSVLLGALRRPPVPEAFVTGRSG